MDEELIYQALTECLTKLINKGTNLNKLQQDWLASNIPSVTIKPEQVRTAEEIEQSIMEHQLLSFERSMTNWPKATRERAKFKSSDDYTTFNYGD